MRTAVNLCVLLLAMLFVSCSSKQFTFRKTYDARTEQQIVQTIKPIHRTTDSATAAVTHVTAVPSLKDSSEKETNITTPVADIKKKSKEKIIQKEYALASLKQHHMFRRSAGTASVQKPAFIFSLILLLLVVALLVIVSLFIAVPFIIFFLALFLVILIVVFLAGLLFA